MERKRNLRWFYYSLSSCLGSVWVLAIENQINCILMLTWKSSCPFPILPLTCVCLSLSPLLSILNQKSNLSLADVLWHHCHGFWVLSYSFEVTKLRKGEGLCLEPCQMEHGDSSGELAKKKSVCMSVCAQTLHKINQSPQIPPPQEAPDQTHCHLPTLRGGLSPFIFLHQLHPGGLTLFPAISCSFFLLVNHRGMILVMAIISTPDEGTGECFRANTSASNFH